MRGSIAAPPMSVAGRPQADEDVPILNDLPLRSNPQLRQTNLFEFGMPRASQNILLSQRIITPDTHTNTPQNSIPWGDPLSFGDDVGDTTFRIMSHNVNGLSTADGNTDVRDFARSIKEKSVSLFGIQETNRNFQRPALVESFHSIIRGVSTHHRGAVSSAVLAWDSNYQPGGTAVSVRNKWATRCLAQSSDDLGRWSTLTLTGKGTTKITFISAYRVCDGASESQIASRTARSQQEWMYNDRGLPAVDLRKQFIVDFNRLIKSFQSKGHDVVVMIDANEASGHNSNVDLICCECSLVDAHSKAVTTTTPPPTYQRGSAKIDFILVSPRVADSIRAASILALHDGYLSDHRALIVDFDAHLLFGSKTSEVVSPASRRLTSTNPFTVHTYLQHMLAHIAQYQIDDKVEALILRSESGTWSTTDVESWEEIDNLLVQGRAAAESKCPTKRSGGLPWSPALETAGKRLLYWKLRSREFSSGITNLAFLESLAASLQLSSDETSPKTSPEVLSLARKAKLEHRLVKKAASERRIEHLAASAQLSAALHGMSENSACAAIASREKSSRQFTQLRRIFNGTKASGLEKIDVPNEFAVRRQGEPVPRIPLVVKEEIEDVLLPHTERRFRQHQETPFGKGSRQEKLGLYCDSSDSVHLRNGTYDRELDSLSLEAREWLLQLKSRDFTKPFGGVISTNISTEDWVAGWSKMRESTASAPGGHYGHYKTASVAARLPSDHPDHTTKLAELYSAMWSLPLKHGFAPKRWSHCIDAIIEKIPGKPIIEKLRIIMLYEADFNFVLKLVWGRRLVRHAEHHQSLGLSNHGSRPGRQTTDALLEKLLIYEHARLSRTSLITVDNDAKSCYDRIIKTLAMISCISVGLPSPAAEMHNRTHHAMVHQIKSKHGLLRPYSGSDSDALEGVGQGSGSGPAIWLIYVVSLLAAFRKFSPGMHILDPYDQRILHILAVFFVDDGMPGVNDALDREAKPLLTLLHQAREASQSWERLLFASGGALELSKCFTYVLYWDLSEGGHRLIAPNEIPGCQRKDGASWGPLSLTYGDSSTEHSLATEEPWVGRRTLGVRLAPAGTWNEEYSFRRTQSRELALRLAGAAISHDTARVAYQTMVCPKLEFPLAVTQFTQKQCDSISSPVLRACLSKMGYNSNMPREVVYGPRSLGGIGLHDYYIEQGIHQLTALVGHVRQSSTTGAMMLSELHWCQAQAGTVHNLLTRPEIPIDYIETCWIMSIRDFLCTYKLHINIAEHIIPQLQCDGDGFIMDVLRRNNASTQELQRLNACRLFLQVARISDIAHPDGKSIRPDILQGRDPSFFISSSRWPRQGRPPKVWWNLWRRKLKQALSIDGNSPNLRHPLGPWFPSHLDSSEWDVLAHTSNGLTTAYSRLSDGSFQVAVTNANATGTRTLVSPTPLLVSSAPAGCTPAYLGPPHKDGRRRVYFRPPTPPASPIPQGCTLSHYVESQPPHIRAILEHCDLSDQTASLLADKIYSSSKLDSGTDGGLLSGTGTFGFAWGIPISQSVIATGKGHVSGEPSQTSSTRTELCGILASLTYLRMIREFFHIVLPDNVSCTIYCDSKAALHRVSHLPHRSFGTTWRCRANYDLEAAISHCLSLNIPTVTWRWVKGHASRSKKQHELTWAEILNEEADNLATLARNTAPSPTIDDPWPEQIISVSSDLSCLRGNLANEIRFCCTSPDIRSYWKTRYTWSDAQIASLEVDGTSAALSKLSPATARRIQKLRCGWLPVNSRESRMDPDRTPGCSACSTSDILVEDVDHIFQCPSHRRRALITSRLSGLTHDLRAVKTSRLIISAILAGTLAWVHDRDIPPVSDLQLPDSEIGRLTAIAYSEQSSLGWGPFFRGFWSRHWRLAQEAQFRQNLSRELHDTGERWSSKAQLWFIKLFESLWGLRNEDEHGADPETQLLIRSTKCESAIRRLYAKSNDLPLDDRHPFRSPLEDLLSCPIQDQELWISLTELFLVKALPRARARMRNRQPAITSFFARTQP